MENNNNGNEASKKYLEERNMKIIKKQKEKKSFMNKVSNKGWLIFLIIAITTTMIRLITKDHPSNSVFMWTAYIVWFIIFVGKNNQLTRRQKVALFFISGFLLPLLGLVTMIITGTMEQKKNFL